MKKSVACALAALLLVPTLALAQSSQQAKVVQLNFIEMLTSPARTAFLNQVIANFEAENPNIKVNLISPPYEQAENKMTLMLNAKQPLDIIESRDGTIKQFVNNGQVADLEPYLKNWSAKDDFLPMSSYAARVIDGKAYIIPQLFFVKGLFVRTDILKKAGIAIPTTVQQLYDASVALSDPAKNQYGYVIRGKSNAWKVSQDQLCLANLQNIDPNNFYKTTDGKFVYDTPEGKAGLQRYVDLFKKAVSPDGVNWGFAEQINAFVSGAGAFLIQDPDAIAMIDKQLGRDSYTVVPVPVGEKSGKAYQDFAFNGLSITSYSQHKDEAWKFLTYLISPKNNSEFCKSYGALPVFSSSFQSDPYFSTGVFKAWHTMFTHPDTYKFVNYPITSPKFSAWGPYQEQYMQRLLLGQSSIDDTIAKWSSYWK
jgi:ABC-type sugar transport system, periplasmic component